MKHVTLARALGAVAALWLGLTGFAPKVWADAALAGEKWTDSIKFNGDLRLRHEDFFNKGVNAVDRHRERLRLRFGVTGAIQDFTAGIRFASGTGEQVSTNQTFTNSWSQKGLNIDQAYISWKAQEHIKLTGGKMPNPIWQTYSTDVMWDKDINPEGYAEQFDLAPTDRLSLFANFAQLPINEISGSNGDPWVFGNQIGLGLKITEDTTWRFGTSFYGFINERKNPFLSTTTVSAGQFDSAVLQEANTRIAGSDQLAGSFQIWDFTTELATHLGPFPISLQGDFVKNTAKGSDKVPSGQNMGYQAGVIVGRAKTAGTWEAAYFNKYLEANATISDWADSDFGNGGTNRKGHIMWIGYAIRDYLTVQGKYFITRRLNPLLTTTVASAGSYASSATPSYSDINRFQLDLVLKF
jgi:hypothetical protein